MTINPTLVFEQFGFIKERETEKDVNGTCPFCKKPGHFGIQIEDPNKKWHCFKCGRGGGFQGFLQTIVKEAKEFKPQVADLAKSRGLSAETLEFLQVGFLNGKWIVPVFSSDEKTVLNIKIYDGESFKNTAGCNAAMYGLWTMPEDYDTIFLCEGEWDTMAMIEMLEEERTAVIGVPGAGTILKPEMIDLFMGKTVYLLYDNDAPGRAGNERSKRSLSPVAAELFEIKWPEAAGNGWDIRDVYTKDYKGDGRQALTWIKGHCELVRQNQVETPEMEGEYVPYTELYATFGKWFHLTDNKKHDQKSTDIYDVIFGMVFANRIPGDPVWLYLIAPPGGFKTEPLLALSGGKLIEIHESVTAPALISGHGQGGVDCSLIPQLNGRLLIIKDWTIILGLPEHERREIVSILRGAFDGVCGRTFGNGITRKIKSTFGIIAASTPVNEQYTEEMAAVGERFLTWRNWISEDYEVRHAHIKRALENTSKELEIRREINAISKRVLLYSPKYIPTSTDAQNEIIIRTAQWVSTLRGSVCRDKFHRNVMYKPFSELGTRLSKEILKLLMGISIFKNEKVISKDTMRIMKSIAWSSVSSRYADTVKALIQKGELNASEAEKIVGLPSETISTVLENLSMLGVVKKVDTMKWTVEPKFYNLTKEAALI